MDCSTKELTSEKLQVSSCEPGNCLPSIFLPEVNKISLYYYGSKDEIIKEVTRTRQLNCFIIHPISLFRRYWLCVMILVTSINMIVIPLDVSFYGQQTDIGWTVYNVLVDIAFVVDLCLNFRMGYYHENLEAVLDCRMIRNHYIKTWFIPDLLAVAPVDYCLLILSASGAFEPGQSESVLKIRKVFSLLRLLRVFRLVRYVNDCMERLSVRMKSNLELIYNIFGIFLICHWNACFQFMLVTIMDYPPNSWVTLEGLVEKPISIQYTKAMFRSLCHMMTLNYGSEVPKGLSELWMMITSITVGTVLYALVLAKITALQGTFHTSQRTYEDKHNELKVYIRHKQVPSTLVPRVFGHMENCYQGKWFDEKSILDDLSEPLKLAVMEHICWSLLKNAFVDTDPLFLTQLLLVVEFESYQAGDVIIRPGVVAEFMYLIDKGIIVVEDRGVQYMLTDGDFFGERGMVRFSKYSIKAWTLSPCRLCSLSVEAYHAVLEGFPELQDKCLVRPSLTASQRMGKV